MQFYIQYSSICYVPSDITLFQNGFLQVSTVSSRVTEAQYFLIVTKEKPQSLDAALKKSFGAFL